MTRPFSYAVEYKGRWCCSCQGKWLPVFERLLHFEGILKPGDELHIYQLIGGAAASSGFHSKGGCADWKHINDRVVWLARQMGADATWHRDAGWDGPGSIEHDHSALTGCPHLPDVVVRNQVEAVVHNYSGLGHLGQEGHDTGPRPLSGRNYQQGIKWAEARMGNAPMTPAEREERNKMLARLSKLESTTKTQGSAITRIQGMLTGAAGIITVNGVRLNVASALNRFFKQKD